MDQWLAKLSESSSPDQWWSTELFLDILDRGCRNGRFGNGVFVLCREKVVLTKIGENSDSAFYPQTTRDFAPQTPAIDENDKNGGCHPGKMTVCQKHRYDQFDNPDLTWLV